MKRQHFETSNAGLCQGAAPKGARDGPQTFCGKGQIAPGKDRFAELAARW